MISSLQKEGVDSSFYMQMGWFETCSQAAINLFERGGHSPPFLYTRTKVTLTKIKIMTYTESL